MISLMKNLSLTIKILGWMMLFRKKRQANNIGIFLHIAFVYRMLGSVDSNKIGLIVIDPVCLVICSMRDKHDV